MQRDVRDCDWPNARELPRPSLESPDSDVSQSAVARARPQSARGIDGIPITVLYKPLSEFVSLGMLDII